MLGHRGDDVVALFLVHLGRALDGQVVALGRTRGKDDFLRGRAHQLRHPFAAEFGRFFADPSEGMVAAGRVAEFLDEVGQHLLEHPRVHGGGGMVVHVDRQLDTIRRQMQFLGHRL